MAKFILFLKKKYKIYIKAKMLDYTEILSEL